MSECKFCKGEGRIRIPKSGFPGGNAIYRDCEKCTVVKIEKLYKYSQDFGRMGSLDGVFICDEEKMNNAMGKDMYMGEVLGKHSEIIGKISNETIKVISDDQEFITKLKEVFNGEYISGEYIFDYIEEDEEDDD